MSSTQDYSRLDRILHHFAFRTINAQIALADLEDRLFSADMDGVPVYKPVFVTSLPRAGTTLLLEVLTTAPELATHTYRDMPFVLCPLLWHRISRAVRKESSLRERLHGDGMQVGYDSPEAFEEILWKTFWQEKYRSDRISLWSRQDRDEEFEVFLHNHMRKIISLRSGGQRYISKNNANISRLELLPTIFPDCRIVVPIRKPLSHVESLLRQHVRFTNIHEQDKFGRQYMEWLGHHEFGATLRPIDFQQWLDARPVQTLNARDFWLTYWIAAYGYILAHAGPNVIFVDYDRLCTEPVPGLRKLAITLEMEDYSVIIEQASRFRAATQYKGPQNRSSDVLALKANETYEALLGCSLQHLDG